MSDIQNKKAFEIIAMTEYFGSGLGHVVWHLRADGTAEVSADEKSVRWNGTIYKLNAIDAGLEGSCVALMVECCHRSLKLYTSTPTDDEPGTAQYIRESLARKLNYR